jgi:hypothetical protein
MTDKLSRRELISSGVTLGAFAVFGVAACGKNSAKPLVCTDTTGLAAADVTVRTSLKYVDISTEPGKSCTGCQQFIPAPAPGSCGTCKVVKGPINPSGYCASFAAKPA